MKLTTFVLAGLAAGAGGALPAQAAPALPAAGLGAIAPLMQSQWDEAAVRRAFQSVLQRDPTPSELRRYQAFMEEYNWTEGDIRRDLQDRPDYQRYSTNRRLQPEAIIRRAYRDILDRNPDPEGMRAYRTKMVDEGWSEQDVRTALRRSSEARGQVGRVSLTSEAEAADMVRRAYRSVLNREPDDTGLRDYTNKVVQEHWTERQIMDALRRSDEYRSKH